MENSQSDPKSHDVAIDEGKVVAWCSVEELGGLVRSHRVDDTVPGAIRRLLRADLVIVDDVGLFPLSSDAAEGLFRLADGAYDRRSIVACSTCTERGRRADGKNGLFGARRPAAAPCARRRHDR